ncbi:RNA polymerase sigma factor SigJ [Streptomyces mirabilis]|uniref:RNA polymerase sigma factor SigJ n=1 Tax=Streptomyces mirabilis TaxID=68239 RepID=UPI0007660BF2|nr:RNA polymerase sigma factor SigJ [Streptomyces mirabilis]
MTTTPPAAPESADAVFEGYRPLLLGLGYRLLGSMWDAEDLVQEAYLRWSAADRAEIRVPRAFLVTVVTRLALDQLRSVRVTREAYTGPWLPEPVASDAFGPAQTAELRDSLAYATLHLMERLTPPERAVFVLREAFELPYDEVAAIVGVTSANCRQLYSRAARHLAAGRERFHPDADAHGELLRRFLDAAQHGHLTALADLLSEDVVVWNDGGGKVRAALWPIEGRANVLAFLMGLLARYGLGAMRLVGVNDGSPAVWTEVDGGRQLVAFDIRGDGLIHGIFAVLNPDKLTHVAPRS